MTIQAKDLPETPILDLIAQCERGQYMRTYLDYGDVEKSFNPREASVWDIEEIPELAAILINAEGTFGADKLVRGKMRRLISRGLVDGCCCGCRGDFTLTDKGREYLAAQTEEEE